MPIITLILRIPRVILTLLAKAVATFSTKRTGLQDLRLRLLISELHYMQQLYLVKVFIQSQYGCRKG